MHPDAERVGDFLQAGEVDTAVVAGLPALDLLLGDADALGELALRELRGDAGFDQRVDRSSSEVISRPVIRPSRSFS